MAGILELAGRESSMFLESSEQFAYEFVYTENPETDYFRKRSPQEMDTAAYNYFGRSELALVLNEKCGSYVASQEDWEGLMVQNPKLHGEIVPKVLDSLAKLGMGESFEPDISPVTPISSPRATYDNLPIGTEAAA
jgi:hypothetical protein